jgi:hypothetical protein
MSHLRDALALHPPGHPNRPVSLTNFANVMLDDSSKQTGRLQVLEKAINHHRNALALCPPGHP